MPPISGDVFRVDGGVKHPENHTKIQSVRPSPKALFAFLGKLIITATNRPAAGLFLNPFPAGTMALVVVILAG